MVDGVGGGGGQFTARVVADCREVDDRVEPGQFAARDVTDVVRVRAWSWFEQSGVESADLVSLCTQEGMQNSA